MVARPTKLTPEVKNELLKVLRAGVFVEVAVRFVGIHRDTYYEWFNRGRKAVEANSHKKADQPYIELYQELERVSAAVETNAVLKLHKMATEEGIWQCLAWFLERRFGERWAKHKIELSGPDGGPIPTAIASVMIYLPDNGRGDATSDH